MQNTPTYKRAAFGQDDGPLPPPSAFAPVLERVGVPLMWMAIGYALCKWSDRKKN